MSDSPPPEQSVSWSPTEPTMDRPRIHLVPFDEIELGAEPVYLIKGLVPRVGLTVVWGPPKSGKSFWTFDAMMHVALGWEYRGRRVQTGPVCYIAAEGAAGLRARIEAFRQHKIGDANEEVVPFYLVPVNIDLVAEYSTLIDAVRDTLGENTPAAVVIDTLNRTLRGSESSDLDMAAYITAADAIRRAFDCAVIIVHHCGIDRSRPRGHTSLTGAVDAQIAIKRDTSDNVVATVEWMKDGAEGDALTSRLVSVEVGTDQDGEAITSCVVDPVDGVQEPAAAIRLNARQRRALEVLDTVLIDDGGPAPDNRHYPSGARVVKVETWREYLLMSGVVNPDRKNPRTDFKRLHEALSNRGVIREWNGLMWKVAGAGHA